MRLFANDAFTLIGSCTVPGGVGRSPPCPINDVTVTEGNAGTVNATFTVTLSPASTGTVTVGWPPRTGRRPQAPTTSPAPEPLTFNPGETTKTVTVAVNGDTTAEANETFFVNLSAPSGATLADSQGQGTITNDDGRGGPDLPDVARRRPAAASTRR